MTSTLSASHCPSAGTQIVSLSLALHFSTSPCNSDQTFQGVVTPLFIHSRGEEAGNDPFPSPDNTPGVGLAGLCHPRTLPTAGAPLTSLLDGCVCSIGKLAVPQQNSLISWYFGPRVIFFPPFSCVVRYDVTHLGLSFSPFFPFWKEF